jgi:Secretion system C-terminal sorting domain
MKKCFYLLNLVALCLLASSKVFALADTVSAPISVHACSGSVGTIYITTNATVTPIWVYSDDGGTSWQPTIDGDVYSGSSTDTLKVVANSSISNRIYCCDLYLGPGMTNLLASGGATVTADTSYVNPITGAGSVCAGNSLTLADGTIGGSWSNFNTAVSTISSGGIVTGVGRGVDTVWYTVANTCGTFSVWQNVTVDTLPGSIMGNTGLCAGTTYTLSNAIPGGSWNDASPLVTGIDAGGVVTALSTGTDVISYTLTNSCGTNTATISVAVDTIPGMITCPASICTGTTATLSNTIGGGTWSNKQTAVDAVTGNILTSVTVGADTVVYTLTNNCGTNTATFAVSSITYPFVAVITGNAGICAGTNDTLADVTTDGIWSNMFSTITSVSATGVVTGVAAGLDTIMYSVTNICGTTTASLAVHVDPVLQPIAGPASVCVGANMMLTESVAGGTWSRLHAAKDSIDASGNVYGLAAGNDTIAYTLTNACGTQKVYYPIVVNTVPTVAAITGATFVCAGAPSTMADVTPGGIWSNHFAADDSINASGVVYALHYGHDSIYYSVTNECGTTTQYKTILTDTMINAGVIAGPTGVCVGSTILLTRSVVGGTWSHTNILLDTLHGSTWGVVTGWAAGIDTIMYSRTNECGSSVASYIIHVDTLNAGVLSGNNVFCGGTTDTLTASATSGTWSTYASSIATVDANGVVTGSLTGAGMDTVYYSVSNSCGTRTAKFPIVVKPAPNAGAIFGNSSVCMASSVTLYDTVIHDSLSTGAWSHSNSGSATITSHTDSVTVHATAAGVDTIFYSVTNSCGTKSTSFILDLDSTITTVSIAGSATLCISQPAAFTGTPAGGAWNVTVPAHATVDASGSVTATATGADTVVYTYTNACGSATANKATVAYSLPNAGAITGSASVCMGSTVTLADTVAGGTWSVTNANGTIGTDGTFTSVTAGKDTVYYAISDAHCTNKAALVERIDTLPAAYPISGPSTVCIGGVILLEDMNTWGTHTWSTSNGNATISATGLLIGATAGAVTVTYNFNNACGSDLETFDVMVQAPLVPGQLMGPAYVCQGSMVVLSDTLANGTWLSSNPYIASVDGTDTYTGMITGRHVGTVTISYTFWNSCGAVTDTQKLTVYGEALPIVGLDSVGIGVYRTLSDPTPGGVWSSTSTTLATVDSTGKVYGLAAGVDTIVYTVSNPCGISTASMIIHVGNKPSAGVIFGTDTVCAGLNINLGDTAIAGGVWSATNGAAAVNSFGVVTGVNGPANDTIVYTVTNGFGSGKVTKKVYVNSVPVVRISHYVNVAIGGQYPMYDTPATGTWWSSDESSIRFVAGPKMIVLGYTHDTVNYNDTLIYTVTNLCGVTRDTLIYHLPSPWVKVNNIANPVSSLNVFPNPSNGNFNIIFGSEVDEAAHVVVTNIMGQKVQEFMVPVNQPSEFKLDQPDGIYLLSASTQTARYDVKIVVSH